MDIKDTYKTISGIAEGIFRDKGSKFIAYIYPFTNEAALKIVLQEVKALHPKARHHCWAYRLGVNKENYRINDDGEPAGTAGRPILNALFSMDVTNVIVVVVRYFGGTLLGVPGLINAYKSATQEALVNASFIEKTENSVLQVECQYVHLNQVMRIIKESNLQVVSQSFDLQCNIKLEVRKAYAEELLLRFQQLEHVEARIIRTPGIG